MLQNLLAAQFMGCYGLSSRYLSYNNKHNTPAYYLHGYKTAHKYQSQLKNYQHNNDFYFPQAKQTSKRHQAMPIVGRGSHTPLNEHADRKITFYENLKPSKIRSSKPPSVKQPIFENFVTPKLEELPKKQYVATTTTKVTRDTVTTARPSRLPDHDVPIAIDEEDVEDERVYAVKGRRRPEHLNPLVYVDSYGKAHKRPLTDDVAAASVHVSP